MTEVQQGNIYVGQEGDHVYDNPEPGSGNDFTTTTTTHSRGKSRCGSQVMSFTSVWINSAIVILFVLVIGALALSIYAIVGRDQAVSGPCSCMVTTGSCSNDTASGGNVQVQELNDTIIQVKELLAQTYTSFEDRYNALNERIISVIQSVRNVSANNELNLYTGCVERVVECILDASEAGTPPSSASCQTPPRPLTVAGMTNTDIYCSIDNSVGETNPIVASVNIFTGEIRCTCSLVALSTSTRQVACKLHVRRCPNTIQLN